MMGSAAPAAPGGLGGRPRPFGPRVTAAAAGPRRGQSHGRGPLTDVEHGERHAFGIVQCQPPLGRRDGILGHVERHRDRPRGPVGERARLAHRRHLGGSHESGQWRERARKQQLQIGKLALVEGPGRKARQTGVQPGHCLSGHVHLRPARRPVQGTRCPCRLMPPGHA
jgi:hypothetical protein